MSETKHTPGPWEVTTRPDSGGGSRPVVTRGPDLICAVSRRDGNDDESSANAILLAESPEMLETLSTLVYWHDQDGRIDESWWDAAREIVARASGRAQGKEG